MAEVRLLLEKLRREDVEPQCYTFLGVSLSEMSREDLELCLEFMIREEIRRGKIYYG